MTFSVESLTVKAHELWCGADLPFGPCIFVRGSESEQFPAGAMLPPCPLVVIGQGHSQLHAHADAIVDDHRAADALLKAVSARPLAASVIVGLLRILPFVPPAEGLIAESLAYATLQGSGEHRRWLEKTRAPAQAAAPGMVLLERKENRMRIMLSRPWADNAIDRPMRDGLCEALRLIALDPSIEKAELLGEGRSFSLGADLNEFGTTTDPSTAHDIRQKTLPARWALRCAARLSVHVQGACVGSGLELAAFAARITANRRAWFQLPELSMGILPGAGGCVSLSRRVGRQRTAELILSGRRISAVEALDWGLIDALMDDPA